MKTPQIAALPGMTLLGLPVAETACHTPGPWRIAQPTGAGTARFIWRNDEGPDFAGETNTNYRMIARDVHSEANASLIAAAPDLLAALAGCVKAYEETRDGEPTGHLWPDPNHIFYARAAIAKAGGR